MTDTAVSRAEPDGAPRIAGLDILRGVAILGILFMNINEMGGSLFASFDDVRHFGWSPADRTVWWLREVLADGTARCLLQLLFGAGMVILTDRAAQAAGERMVVRRYYVRNLVLLAFGLVHLFVLLWPGDILHTYALAALVVVLFRHLPARLLLFFGLSMMLFELGSGGASLYSHGARQEAVAAAQARARAGQPATRQDGAVLAEADAIAARAALREVETRRRIAQEDAARTGSFRSWAGAAWNAILFAEGKGLELMFVWEAAASMLIGAALYRWGVIQGARPPRFHAGLMLAGYVVGLPLRLVVAAQVARFDGAPDIGWATYDLARVATTLGHVGLIHLLLASGAGRRLLHPFVAAGRTALSLYILQTLICLWLLYPPFALALYGRQGWAGLMATALAIDIVLLLLANWWVARFTIAPVEWAWRSLAEGRLPFGRRVRPGASPPA